MINARKLEKRAQNAEHNYIHIPTNHSSTSSKGFFKRKFDQVLRKVKSEVHLTSAEKFRMKFLKEEFKKEFPE